MNDMPKPNRPMFKQPVAMRCTSAQIKFIYNPLSKLGYWEDDLRYQPGRIYLCTNSFGRPPFFGLTDSATDWNRVHLLEYDHRCFLAIAAMTVGEKFIPGEYCKMGKNIFQVTQVNNLRNLLYVCEVNEWVPASELRKPTAIELLTFFKMPYVGWTTEQHDELSRASDRDSERNVVQP